MRPADSVTAIGSVEPDRVRDKIAAGSARLSGSSSKDPIAAQKGASAAISRILEAESPGTGQLEALLGLDAQTETVGNRLVRRYVEGEAQSRSFDPGDWISALRLSRSFFQAYELLLRNIEETTDLYWLAQANLVIAQMFHHRRAEWSLRLIRYKKRIPGQWKEIHTAYKFALTRGIATEESVAGTTTGPNAKAASLDQEFLRLLLLDSMNTGQFSPRDVLWADAWFARWCTALRVESREAVRGLSTDSKRFVIDLDGTDGFKRSGSAAARDPLYLDPSPLLALIGKEFESLRNSSALVGEMTPAMRAGKVALLTKLRAVFDPRPFRIVRRGERSSMALPVQTITGLGNIIQALRDQERTRSPTAAMPGAQTEGITFSPLGAETWSPTVAGEGATPTTLSIAKNSGVIPETWHLRDRSDSGSRLRGQIDDLNRVIPGSLIAIRDAENAPWTVAVVRRFRRLMVNFVEIGVEHIGRGPHVVKLVDNSSLGLPGDPLGKTARRCFVALYLPPSDRQPTMPIKTLLLPARELSADSNVTLLSSSATYTLRLNEPIQQQFEYIWASFTVIEKTHVSKRAKTMSAVNS